MNKYDNYNSCSSCLGENEVEVKDTINGHIAECSTECKACGFADYWAHGFFESRQESIE